MATLFIVAFIAVILISTIMSFNNDTVKKEIGDKLQPPVENVISISVPIKDSDTLTKMKMKTAQLKDKSVTAWKSLVSAAKEMKEENTLLKKITDSLAHSKDKPTDYDYIPPITSN